MAISIVSNIASLSAQRSLNKTQAALETNMGRLATGLRINRAGDDSAGLAISEKFRAQTRSMSQAERNGMDGISMLQVAEGGMNETANILARMRELAVQSANSTNSATDRDFLDQEFQELLSEIDRVSAVTQFNGVQLIDGTATDLDFQIGINTTSDDVIQVLSADLDVTAATLAVTGLDVQDRANSLTAIDAIDAAIDSVSTARSTVGAAQNRMQVAVANLGNMRENLSAAESRIRDVDVAEETAAMTRQSILMQSGVAVLAQANQQPAMALSLIG